MSTQPTPAAARHCKVAIIGTGFSGLGMAIRLRQEGEDDFLIFERTPASAAPGESTTTLVAPATCNPTSIPSPSKRTPEWTRMFARQPEIRAYLEKCWENTACRKRPC